MTALRLPRPHVPVRNDAELTDRWRALMGPLGFSRRVVWLSLLDRRGRMLPTLTQIEDLPPQATDADCRALLELCWHLVGSGQTDPRSGSVALLLTRPGHNPMTEGDRSWARGWTEAARDRGVSLWPVHLATDRELRPFAPDDLLVSQAAG